MDDWLSGSNKNLNYHPESAKKVSLKKVRQEKKESLKEMREKEERQGNWKESAGK